jgi:preprotein translocase subunit SecG
MVFFIGLLTVIMVLDCLVLILLVLMQLPKKDAGAGLAFGGAATDALFGAGSGNFLTKATKYAAVIFFLLAIILSVLQSQYSHRGGAEFRHQLEQQSKEAPITVTPPPPAAPQGSATVSAPPGTSNILLLTPPAMGTASSNSAPVAPK